MRQLIKKYAGLLILAIILSHLLTGLVLTIWPNLLIEKLPNGGTSTLATVYLVSGFEYLINIGFIILLAKDMEKENLKSIPILIISFFSGFVGVVFFLLAAAHLRLISTKNKNV